MFLFRLRSRRRVPSTGGYAAPCGLAPCEDPMEHSADYVVAGAGSAGCVLARRLAESGASVILLEAGGPDRTRLVRKPGMIAIFHNVPALKKRLDWGFYTAPQPAALGRRIPQPRGRVLGGSGSINGMVFVRGNQQELRRLGRGRVQGLVVPGRAAQLQADGGLGGRRQRAARRRRADQGDQAEGPDPGVGEVHRGAGRTPPASPGSTTTTASRRKASRSSSRTPAAGCATAPRSATWTATACRA